MKVILIDSFGFTKDIELSEDTEYFEIPTNREVKDFTFFDGVFNFYRFKNTHKLLGEKVTFEMVSSKVPEPIYWLNR
jgi:hypothetical protein